MVNASDGDPVTTDTTTDDTLPPAEATDSDELRNDDGDLAVTAPDQWFAADDDALSGDASAESLDDKLAAEEPETGDVERLPTVGDETVAGRHRGQIGGSPEDGESFFPAEE